MYIALTQKPRIYFAERDRKMVEKENSKISTFHLHLFSVSSVFRRIWLTKVVEQGHLSGRATVAATKVWLLAKVALQSWERGGLQMI